MMEAHRRGRGCMPPAGLPHAASAARHCFCSCLSTGIRLSVQALELGEDKGTGMRWPLFPTFSDGKAGPAQVQSADASRTLSSSLASSFNDGDGVRCACESCQPADARAQRRTASCRRLTMR